MSRTTMRTLITFGAVTSLALTGCAGGSEAGGEVDTIRVGYHADWNGASLVSIAEEQGLWEEHDLEAELSVFTSGPIEVQALQAGDLDFAYIGQGAMWLPASGQAKIATINTLSAAGRVIAQPGITSMDQLRGKKVAVPEGTSGELVLRQALEQAGMTMEDIEIVPMDAATVVSAFSSGQVDGAATWYPLISTIKESVPDLEELASEADLVEGGGSPTAFLTSNEIAAENPELVEKFDSVMREAMDYRAENEEEAIQTTADFLEISPEAVASDASHITTFSSDELADLTESGQVSTWLTNLNDFFITAGSMEEQVDPSEYYLSDIYLQAGE